MIEEATGAVVIVGGLADWDNFLDIFRLSDAKSKWMELPQKLGKDRCCRHVAFLVPDAYTECLPSTK